MEMFRHVIDGADVESGRRQVRLGGPLTRGGVRRGRPRRPDRGRPRGRRGPTGVRRGAVAADGVRRARRAAAPARRPGRRALRRARPRGHARHGQADQRRARTRDVPRTAQNLRFFADHARLAVGETFPMDSGHHAYSLFQPAGVVAAISPWNFPLMLESWKIAPALAWGNTVVLKPAEDTPKSATLLARLATEAGMPPGVLNVVHGFGPDSAGSALTQHRGVDRITFTGESATGARDRPGRGGQPHPGQLRAGRQGRQPGLRRRRPRQRRRLVDQGDLHQRRAGLPGRLPAVRAARRPRRVPGPVRRRRRGADPGRPEGSGDRDRTARLRGALEEGHAATWTTSRRAPDGSLTGGLGGRLVRPADGRRRRAADARVVLRGDLRAAGHRAPVRHRGGGRPARQRLAVRTQRDGLHREPVPRAPRLGRAAAGTVWVNCFFIRDLRAPFGGVGDSGVGREGGTFSREFFTEPKAVVMSIRP